MRIEDIIGDLEKSSGGGPASKTTKIPNVDCIQMGKVSKVKERFEQQPAKISAVCDWSRKMTNSDKVSKVSGAKKRKGEELMQTKTKKLRLSQC